jgi:hypothetical protein
VTSTSYRVERVGFGVILCIALLMFFQPLVRVHGPTGRQISNISNVRDGMSQLQSNLRSMAAIKYLTGASLVSVAGAPTAPKPMAIPFSLRMAALVPWFVFAALAFCLLALLDHILFQKAFAIFSLAAGCAALLAVLHVMLMGADLRSWTEILMNTVLISTPPTEDPSGAIMMASSFVVSPGFGLYDLTICLLVVPCLWFTRAVPRVSSVVRRERRVSLSQPISLRPVNSRYPAENCTCLDTSDGGLLVESSMKHHYVGMEVYLARNVRAGDPANPEEHGSVVRVEKGQSDRSHIAIRLIPEG